MFCFTHQSFFSVFYLRILNDCCGTVNKIELFKFMFEATLFIITISAIMKLVPTGLAGKEPKLYVGPFNELQSTSC